MSLANTTSPTSVSETRPGDHILGSLQSLGRALMLPIAVLPAAALLLRLGSPDLLNWPWMAAAGNAVFAATNLPFIFALGIGIGLAEGEGAAAIAAGVGFFVFTAVFDTIYDYFVKPAAGAAPSYTQMGVLSGIIIGITAALLYRRFYDIRLPDYLGFFGGKRFVPIITALVALVFGLIFGLIWPPIQQVINLLGDGIIGIGPWGAALYGFFNRLLIPLGLHQVLNSYIWFQLGTFKGVHGDLNRYFAGDPSAGLYMSGYFPIFMFGLPAACLAMIRHAKFPKVAAGILLAAAFTSFLTGITEPIEYAFIFVAPVLFVIHALLTGTSLFICYILNIHIGFGFSAGLIDYVLNFTKSNTQNGWMIIPIGIVYAVIYYFLFSFFIIRFNLGTPGRGEESTGLSADWILPESQRGPRKGKAGATATIDTNPSGTVNDDNEATETESGGVATATATADKDDILAEQVLAALGTKENIESLEGCITRLRTFVKDPNQVDEARLKSLGAAGVLKRGKVVQVILGTQSDRIASRINKMRKS